MSNNSEEELVNITTRVKEEQLKLQLLSKKPYFKRAFSDLEEEWREAVMDDTELTFDDKKDLIYTSDKSRQITRKKYDEIKKENTIINLLKSSKNM